MFSAPTFRSAVPAVLLMACLACSSTPQEQTQKVEESHSTQQNQQGGRKEISVEPQGTFAEIDVAASNAAVVTLRDGNAAARQAVKDQIAANPLAYNPTALLALGQAHFLDGQKDEAARWFFMGDTRAHIDAQICLDLSARQKTASMRQGIGQEFLLHIVENAQDLLPLLDKTLAYLRENDASYDRRWINLHGMGAMISALAATEPDAPEIEEKPMSEPREKWPEITTKVIEEYRNGFMKLVK